MSRPIRHTSGPLRPTDPLRSTGPLRSVARRPARHRATAATAGLLASTLLLAACGSDTDDDTAADADGTRTVDTVMGEVRVPENPERVMVLDTAELDSAVTLGVMPVGTVRADVAGGMLSYLTLDGIADTAHVGNIGAPNLEAIAELEPDLILGNIARDEERYDQLSEIAPTVLGENPGSQWKENFLLHAEALNKEDEGQEAIAAYEDHVAEVTEALGGPEAAAETEVSVLRFIEGADSRLYGHDNYIGRVLDDIGVGRPDIVADAEDGFAVEISSEQVDLADADVLYYTSYGATEESGQSDMVGSPLWEEMGAVRDDRAHHVDDELWFLGIGYTAAALILDELVETLPKNG